VLASVILQFLEQEKSGGRQKPISDSGNGMPPLRHEIGETRVSRHRSFCQFVAFNSASGKKGGTINIRFNSTGDGGTRATRIFSKGDGGGVSQEWCWKRKFRMRQGERADMNCFQNELQSRKTQRKVWEARTFSLCYRRKKGKRRVAFPRSSGGNLLRQEDPERRGLFVLSILLKPLLFGGKN